MVDEITQFPFLGSLERLSKHFLLPVLEALLGAFPFTLLGFHADNGSEHINHRVAQLLEKRCIQEFTKSRSRQSTNNALVESKNGSVVRKHLGYASIPGRFAFTPRVLSPYLNFHRPCFFPTEEVDAKGRYRYKDRTPPYEKLQSLPNASQYLKPGLTFKQLGAIAYAISDNEAAQALNKARAQRFRSIHNAHHPTA